MGIYIEVLILYIVLFLSRTVIASRVSGAEAAAFSVQAELARTFLHSIPSLALIFYLVFKSGRTGYSFLRPGRKDLTAAALSLPYLLITGLSVSVVSSFTGAAPSQAAINSPATAVGWIVLIFSFISAAYLEEGFFRFYLLSQRDKMNLSAPAALGISVALFSICHIYEGPWGFLNSALSAGFLGFVFLRYHSLHGLAVAHGLYNIAVYIISSLQKTP